MKNIKLKKILFTTNSISEKSISSDKSSSYTSEDNLTEIPESSIVPDFKKLSNRKLQAEFSTGINVSNPIKIIKLGGANDDSNIILDNNELKNKGINTNNDELSNIEDNELSNKNDNEDNELSNEGDKEDNEANNEANKEANKEASKKVNKKTSFSRMKAIEKRMTKVLYVFCFYIQ